MQQMIENKTEQIHAGVYGHYQNQRYDVVPRKIIETSNHNIYVCLIQIK